ncbi:hypothetical protein F5144DRAFT_590993 [Chaetomium tenue]|uniref:Uncharacterized protein n=1 Tax=Chaetomium tenue TaxID=1854479 RepID=A0ACB7PP39_9PEZI|nr:hypothetical protein F5144DRAFT_590993 [Chaetomium globosum]
MILQPTHTPESDQQLALFQSIPWCAAHLSGYPQTLVIGPSLTQRRATAPRDPPRPRTPHHPRPRLRRARPHARRLGGGVPRRGGGHADGRDHGAGVCGEPAARAAGRCAGHDGVSQHAVCEARADGHGGRSGPRGGDGYGEGGKEGGEEVLDGGGCAGWGGGGAGEGGGVVCCGEGDVTLPSRKVNTEYNHPHRQCHVDFMHPRNQDARETKPPRQTGD